MTKKGLFFAIEGVDGTGKSSILHALEHWEELFVSGKPPTLCKVPSYRSVSHMIRDILASKERRDMRPNVIDLLYLAAQIQEDQAVAWPALASGANVIADRWFISQLAYSVIRPVDKYVLDLYRNLHAKTGPHPDLTIILTCDPWIALERAQQRPEKESEVSRQIYKEWGDSPSMIKKIQDEYSLILERDKRISELMGGADNIHFVDTTTRNFMEVIEEVKEICKKYKETNRIKQDYRQTPAG